MATLQRRRRRKVRLFCADSTLYEMEQHLEHCFFEEETNLRTVGDLHISYEDYKYLNFKLKGILHYISRVEVMEQYRFCILTTLVFAIRYEKNVTITLKNYEEFMNQFQQHQVRFFLRMMADTFHEMSLPTYGIKVKSCKVLLELLSIHANIPKSYYDEIFGTLNNYYTQKKCYLLEEEVYNQLDRVLLKIYPFLSPNGDNFCLSRYLKELYEACYRGHKTLEELFEEFGTLSKELIENCYHWYNTYSKNSNNLIKIL